MMNVVPPSHCCHCRPASARVIILLCVLLSSCCFLSVHGFAPASSAFAQKPGITTTFQQPLHNKPIHSSSTSTTQLHIKPHASKVHIALQSNNAVRGKLMVIAHKVLVSPAKYKYILVDRILPMTYWPEVVLIAAMWNSKRIAQWIYFRRHAHDESMTTTSATYKAFRKSKSLKMARVLQQVGFLQAALYISDVCLVLLKLLEFQWVVKYEAQRVAASMMVSIWLAYNASRLKHYYLKRYAETGRLALVTLQRKKKKERAEQAKVEEGMVDTGVSDGTIQNSQAKLGTYNRFANRIADVLIYSCAFLTLVDLLGIQLGFAIKSIFGLGSFGTLVLSLASKDVAAEFVGGLMIQSSSFFREGETVELQDKTTGVVTRVGWLHTYILKDDNMMVRVPNSQISHQRIARPKRTKGNI